MKSVLVIRHASWNLIDDKLTDEGREKCIALRPEIGSMALALSSPFGRTQETAELLSGLEPITDERASILKSPPEISARVAQLRKTHSFGVAGAIISVPELREPLRHQGEALKDLVDETMRKLSDEQQALIVSHDGTMVALEKVLTGASFDRIDHTYGELEGFRIDDRFQAVPLVAA